MTAPRNKPGRRQAKDVSDLVFLIAVEAYHLGGLFPLDLLHDQYPALPKKVLAAKHRKAVDRGWVTRDWKMTRAGLDELRRLGGFD